jgi:predicted nucleic acid-binding protein
MAAKVIDASALGAVIFGEPERTQVRERLRGATLAAPALLRFEMASICFKKLRRDQGARPALMASLRVFERMRIAMIDVKLAAVVDLANDAGLSVYDASYLWLARQLNAELVTLDAQLGAASAIR